VAAQKQLVRRSESMARLEHDTDTLRIGSSIFVGFRPTYMIWHNFCVHKKLNLFI
jgi:hypothetical protein